MQINHGVNELLLKHVVLGAQERGVQQFMDLFCGAGNFSLALASTGLKGVGVEVDERAVWAAERSAAEQELDGVAFRCLDLREEPETLTSEALDLLILNPPRAGLKGDVSAFSQLNAQYICLCECRPESLVRDLVEFERVGYRLTELTLFDMFPHTEHVESVAWLTR